MSWTRLDDKFDMNPKLVKAIGLVGDSAGWMWVRAVCYCNNHLTDGRVPREVIPNLTSHRRPYSVAKALVDCGVFDQEGGDFAVHDFLQWNDSRRQVLDKRETARSRKDSFRKSAERKCPTSQGRAADASGTVPKPNQTKPNKEYIVDSTAREVFDHYLSQWNQVVGGTNPPKFTDKREAMIRARLADGFTASQLRSAISSQLSTGFNVDNGHTGIEVSLRSVEQVEKYLNKAKARTNTRAEHLDFDPIGTEQPAQAVLDLTEGIGNS